MQGVINASLRTVCLLAATLSLLNLVGCKAGEAASAGFVDKRDMYADASLPFQKVWKKPGFDKSKYTQLYVAPVNTTHMLSMTEWQEGSRQSEIEQDVANLAAYLHNDITNAFRQDPRHRMQIVGREAAADPKTLVLEVALIEVIPSKVALNALGYAPFYIGTALTAVRTVADDVSSVAFEARIRDGATGEIVGKMADREQQKTAVVDVRALTWYGDIQGIMDDWSKQFVEIANRKPGETVKDADPFTLRPW